MTWGRLDHELVTPSEVAEPMLEVIEKYAHVNTEAIFALLEKALGDYNTGSCFIALLDIVPDVLL